MSSAVEATSPAPKVTSTQAAGEKRHAERERQFVGGFEALRVTPPIGSDDRPARAGHSQRQ